MSDAAVPPHPVPASLIGQVAVVTGGGRGIGQAIVRALAQAGASVVAASRTYEELEQTVALVAHDGGSAQARTVDVTDRAAVDTLVDDVLSEFGQIDVLVNNAGSCAAFGPVWDIDPDLWLRDLTTNLFGSFLCVRAVLPSMIARRQGIIINLNGGGGTEPLPFISGYASSKAGILRFTDSLAAEVTAHNIFVYALGPGLVRTAMTEHLMRHPRVDDYFPSFAAAITSGDTVPPDQAGRLVVLLATLRDPRLSGRVFHIETPLAELLLQAEKIEQDDLYTLRLRL